MTLARHHKTNDMNHTSLAAAVYLAAAIIIFIFLSDMHYEAIPALQSFIHDDWTHHLGHGTESQEDSGVFDGGDRFTCTAQDITQGSPPLDFGLDNLLAKS
ncbi:hypothetical protein MN608_04490 [Microdochium nivale]|nr:hypothetical protein MN608_04490 [Microdochium nivale]